MSKSIREKINKDDGKHFQVGNHDLNLKEIIGFAFLILAMLIYLFVDKAGFQHAWLGWTSCVIGFVLVTLGVIENDQQSNT
jgi:uncharacterized membrane protein